MKRQKFFLIIVQNNKKHAMFALQKTPAMFA
jgi:hypothetical protein